MNSNKTQSTIGIAKDLAKCMVLEGRRSLATGLHTVAEKVDINQKQASDCNQFRKDMAHRKAEKETSAQVAPSKA